MLELDALIEDINADNKGEKVSEQVVEEVLDVKMEEVAPVVEEVLEVKVEEVAPVLEDVLEVKEEEVAPAPEPAPEPAPSNEEVLLAEIRDLLKEKK